MSGSGESSKRIGSVALLVTFIALMALALASFLLSFVHLGPLSAPVAMLIAAAKALLVALVFMELLVERFSVRIVAVTAFAWVLLLIAFMAADIKTRSVPPIASPTTPERSRY